MGGVKRTKEDGQEDRGGVKRTWGGGVKRTRWGKGHEDPEEGSQRTGWWTVKRTR